MTTLKKVKAALAVHEEGCPCQACAALVEIIIELWNDIPKRNDAVDDFIDHAASCYFHRYQGHE